MTRSRVISTGHIGPLLVVAALCLAGCGASETRGVAAEPTQVLPETSPTSTVPNNELEIEVNDPTPRYLTEEWGNAENPILAFMGFPGDLRSATITMNRAHQRQIQSCLHDLGFSYTPPVDAASEAQFAAEQEERSIEERKALDNALYGTEASREDPSQTSCFTQANDEVYPAQRFAKEWRDAADLLFSCVERSNAEQDPAPDCEAFLPLLDEAATVASPSYVRALEIVFVELNSDLLLDHGNYLTSISEQ